MHDQEGLWTKYRQMGLDQNDNLVGILARCADRCLYAVHLHDSTSLFCLLQNIFLALFYSLSKDCCSHVTTFCSSLESSGCEQQFPLFNRILVHSVQHYQSGWERKQEVTRGEALQHWFVLWIVALELLLLECMLLTFQRLGICLLKPCYSKVLIACEQEQRRHRVRKTECFLLVYYLRPASGFLLLKAYLSQYLACMNIKEYLIFCLYR